MINYVAVVLSLAWYGNGIGLRVYGKTCISKWNVRMNIYRQLFLALCIVGGGVYWWKRHGRAMDISVGDREYLGITWHWGLCEKGEWGPTGGGSIDSVDGRGGFPYRRHTTGRSATPTHLPHQQCYRRQRHLFGNSSESQSHEGHSSRLLILCH